MLQLRHCLVFLTMPLVLVPSTLPAQIDTAYGLVEIRNVGTGLYIDVSHGRLRDGQPVWTWSGNTTDAQYFRVTSGRDQNVARIGLANRNLVLTLLGPPIDRPDENENVLPHIVRLKTFLREDPPPSPIGFDPQPVTVAAQEWRFEDVDGARDTFVIRSMASNGQRVLTSSGSEQGSRLVLQEYRGSADQHWVLEVQSVEAPTNVVLERFWYGPGGRLRGEIGWQGGDGPIDHYRVTAENDAFALQRSPKVAPTERDWSIEFEPGTEAEGVQWCFRVGAVNERAGSDYDLYSPPVCRSAERLSVPQPTYSKAVIANCHPDRISVRFWVSENGGDWQDRGLLQSQMTNSGCPHTGQPKTIELRDGAVSQIVAMHPDCGSESPADAQASCRVLASPPLQGEASSDEIFEDRIGG